MYEEMEKFAKRLTDLRVQKDVSAREMSLDLGQNPNYVNRIENRKAMPSFEVFFNICEYLDVTPGEFFDYGTDSPAASKELLAEVRKLDYMETRHLLEVVKDINKKR